jgi:hypothetical protein
MAATTAVVDGCHGVPKMDAIRRQLDEHGMPFFGRALRRAILVWEAARPLLRRAWDSDFRKRYISWTRFREKRLTLRGFLSFDRNARIRTYIYLAIAAAYLGSFYGPSRIVQLVRIACQAIEMAGLPQNVYSTMMYEKAVEVHALQQALTARYDANHDGRLELREAQALTAGTGLAVAEVRASCIEGNLDRLLGAAYAKHALPQQVTDAVPNADALPPADVARSLRRWNYQMGVKEYERQRAQMWREVNPRLVYEYAKPRDYLKWVTWRRGLVRFYETGKYYISAPYFGVSCISGGRR